MSLLASSRARQDLFRAKIQFRGVLGAGEMMIYQPHHPTVHDLQDSPAAVRHIYALVDNIDS